MSQKTKSEEAKETEPIPEKKCKPKFVPIPRPAEKEEYEKHMVEGIEEDHKTKNSLQHEREKRKLKMAAPILIGTIIKPKTQKIELPKVPTKHHLLSPIKNIDKFAEETAEKIHLQKEIEEGYVDKEKDRWKNFIVELQQIDPILIEALYLMCEIPKDMTAIKTHHYKEEDLLNSILSVLQLNHKISEERKTLIREKLFTTIRQELNSNPLYLHKIENIVLELYGSTLKETLYHRIAEMSTEEKKIVLVYLLKPLEPFVLKDYLNKFNLYFNRCFNAAPRTDVLITLVKAGIFLRGDSVDGALYKPVGFLEYITQELKKKLSEDMRINLDEVHRVINELDEELKLEEDVKRGRVEQNIKIWEGTLDRLKNIDFILIDMLYTIATTSKGVTAVGRGYYTEDDLWESVKRNMQIKYEISDEQFEKYKEILYDEIWRKMHTNLLYLFRSEADIIFRIVGNELLEHIKKRVQDLNDIDKKAVLVFLCAELEPWSDWTEKFNSLYETCFKEKYKGDIRNALVKSNILVYGIWITSKGEYRGPEYIRPDSFSEILKNLKKSFSQDLGINLENLTGKIKEKLEKFETAKVEEEVTDELAARKRTVSKAEEASHAEDLEVFEKIIKSTHGNFLQNILEDKPVVVILAKSDNDNYGTTISILFREIFKELVGGLAIGRIRSKGDKDIEKDLRAEDRIEYIDDNKTEYVKCEYSGIKTFEKFKMCVNWEKLSDRLEELIFQGFGVIIFQVKRDYVERLKEEVEKRTGDRKPQILILYPQIEGESLSLIKEKYSEELNLIEIKKKIASACWGFVEPKGDDRWDEGITFDHLFSACENAFDERLKEVARSPIKINKEKIPSNMIVMDSLEESNYHYWMKVFAVKYLIENMKIPKENIVTEERLWQNGPIPDIKANNVIIEIETLYGTGRPLNKIAETIKKYRGGGFEVWIVVKNIDVLFYYPEMIRLLENVNKDWGIHCKFLTLNLEDKKLIDIKEMKRVIDQTTNQVLNFEDHLESQWGGMA